MALTKKTAARFDAAMPPKDLDLAQSLLTAVQGPAGNSTQLAGGQVTVANGATTATVTGLDAFNDCLVLLTPGQADTYASVHWFGAVAGGTLTVTVDADPGNAAGLKLNYLLIKTAALV